MTVRLLCREGVAMVSLRVRRKHGLSEKSKGEVVVVHDFTKCWCCDHRLERCGYGGARGVWRVEIGGSVY